MSFPHHGMALAPMRALTQPPLWKVISSYGAPDAFFTEFVRVHERFRVDERWVDAALKSAKNHALWVQLMGNDPWALVENIRILEKFPIAGVDFNVGCPVPKIYKKSAGGGLLRDLPLLNRLVRAMREHCKLPFSVKVRTGFSNSDLFEALLQTLVDAKIDLLTVHARTVVDLYHGKPRYEFVRKAVESCPFPVLANGDIDSIGKANFVLKKTGCHGIMVGRAAVRNPWIFLQWRSHLKGEAAFSPKLKDVYGYLQAIYLAFSFDKRHEQMALGCMKRFIGYVGQGIDSEGQFLRSVRQATNLKDFWRFCDVHLLEGPQAETLYRCEAYSGVFAQPNKECIGSTRF